MDDKKQERDSRAYEGMDLDRVEIEEASRQLRMMAIRLEPTLPDASKRLERIGKQLAKLAKEL